MFTESKKADRPAIVHDASYFHVSGLSHKVAPVEIRERFAVKQEKYRELLGDVLTHPAIDEAVLLSTCNRTEIVTAGEPEQTPVVRQHIEEVFECLSGVSRSSFQPSMYHLDQDRAVSHVFRVAAGLDSMIVGEPQVLGQLKVAFEEALGCGATKELLNRLFHRAFGVAKVVRTETRIGHSAVSVCYAAKELATQIFGDLQDASVLLLGAGETGALALKHLRTAGSHKFFIANKTLQKAANLAEEFSGIALDLRKCGDVLEDVDIVIGACALSQADPAIISMEQVRDVLRRRRGKPQFFIDLSVPRNFAPEVNDLSDAFLYNIDDLERVVARNLDSRSIELRRAEVIVDDQVRKFGTWLESRIAIPAICQAKDRVESLECAEMAKTMRRLKRAGLTDVQCRLVEAALGDYSHALIGKLLHKPLTALRERSATDPTVLAAFHEFFLDTDDEQSTNVVQLRKV